MTQLADSGHYQHTTKATVPPSTRRAPAPRPIRAGDPVTIGPPYDHLPVILSMQRHVHAAASEVDGFVKVRLGATSADQQFHMVPADQILHGWLPLS